MSNLLEHANYLNTVPKDPMSYIGSRQQTAEV